jgi:hypothetical protein
MSTATKEQLLQSIEEAATATTLADAVKALADAQIPETIPNLIRALNYNNPGAAVAAVDGLIATSSTSSTTTTTAHAPGHFAPSPASATQDRTTS